MIEAKPQASVLKNAVLLACRAPSVHNTQPWRWRMAGDELRLFVDRYRAVPGTDPSGRDTLLSCGAVLNHLCAAMTAAGWRSRVSRFPDPNDPAHLASVEFTPLDRVTDAQRRRADAILRRRTDRLPFAAPRLWDRVEPVLRDTADDARTRLDVLDDDRRPRLAEASRLTEALRRDDASYHAELDWWTSSFRLGEGVPPDALASAGEHRRVDVGRAFPGASHPDRRAAVAVDHSKVVVLSTSDDDRPAVLRCGEALSAVLLECTMAGLATCPLSHLIELDESRDVVRELIDGRGAPQLLIRVGRVPPLDETPPSTPRRPLHEVLEIG